VADNAQIAALYVFNYTQPSILQKRVALSDDEGAIIDKARAIRAAVRLPFWESVMLSCFGGARGSYTRLVSEARFHQSHRETLRRMSREAVLSSELTVLSQVQPADQPLSFSSIVEVDGGVHAHLPLLDFHCPESPANDLLVAEVAKILFTANVILFSSGESYHAIGLELLSEERLMEFLARSVLFAPIVDSRYVAHQMLEKACALRLSRSIDRPKQPALKIMISSDQAPGQNGLRVTPSHDPSLCGFHGRRAGDLGRAIPSFTSPNS